MRKLLLYLAAMRIFRMVLELQHWSKYYLIGSTMLPKPHLQKSLAAPWPWGIRIHNNVPPHMHSTVFVHSYCMTQHLHLGFFLMVTCSTWDASPGVPAVPLCTSTAPGVVVFWSFWTLPLALFCVALSSAALFGDSTVSDLSVWSSDGREGPFAPGVGVIGFPPFISCTISSASRLKSPPGWKGLSQPLSVLKAEKKHIVFCFDNMQENHIRNA